jgi:threonine/homoserine/homoserine lactone efflux protein
MEYVTIILTGWAIGLIAAVPIGPVNLICIRRTLQFGRLYGFTSGLGAALGDGLFACIAGFSLTAISQLITGDYAVPLQLLGGTMLVVIGLRMFFAAPPSRMSETYGPLPCGPNGVPSVGGKTCVYGANGTNGNGKNGKQSRAKGMATTFALTTTNPATLAWFFGGAGALSGLSESPRFFQAAFWVLGVMLGSTTWWFSLTTAVGKAHAMISDRVVVFINRVSGAIVILFGLLVLLHVAFPHLFSGTGLTATAARHAGLPIHWSL